ncbi:putative two-component system sensor kinase [Nocardia nova SH22a]|uniref:Putative two-component system sensor kinase n=1 Tax=Nocardia nova SH22a TaxID=1415166 RepID=W5TTP8_9NOCA|nr:putative two-component system sensor kinase [Nocardia nova SH22a]
MTVPGPAWNRPVAAVLDRLAGRTIDRTVTDRRGVERRRFFFGGLLAIAWLIYLVGGVTGAWHDGRHWQAVLAGTFLLFFWTLIATTMGPLRQPDWDEVHHEYADPRRDRLRWAAIGALAVLSFAETALLGLTALPTLIYVAVAAVFVFPPRISGRVVATVSALMVGSTLIPALHYGTVPLYFAFVPVLMWVGREVGTRRGQLRELTRRQQGELAIVEERSRVARDVHDILGHSLTVITVKTELAQRLLATDPVRAGQEMADVERLAREALAGVRDTVGGLREVTLAGELANARTALHAAGIEADLPDAAAVNSPHAETFAWVLREAVTNIVRHSGARHCWVRADATHIEIADDGTGLQDKPLGSGLTGLRERVRADGGSLSVTASDGGGVSVAARYSDPVPN